MRCKERIHCLATILNGLHFESHLVELVNSNQAVDRTIFSQKDAQLGQRLGRRTECSVRWNRDTRGESKFRREPERSALAFPAFNSNASAHQFDKLSADGKP